MTTAETSPGEGIWDEQGRLAPLAHDTSGYRGDVAVIIVNRDRPDLVAEQVAQLRAMGVGLKLETFVVEMGSDPAKLSEHCSIRYDDDDFKGKCYGHNVGLRHVLSKGRFRYYWFMMNDVQYPTDMDPVAELISIMERSPRLGLLSPSEPAGSPLPYAKTQPGEHLRPVFHPDYLSIFMRGEALEQVGFLNPEFKYTWGAIHELAFKLYSADWTVAYTDRVTMKHLGGTTYGKVKKVISRQEYMQRAREFAGRYMKENYGSHWDQLFNSVLPPEVDGSLLPWERESWEKKLPENRGRDLKARWRRRRRRRARVLRGHGEGRSLEERIAALHPWDYDVTVGPLRVRAGRGSEPVRRPSKERVAYRQRLLVDEVLSRYDVSGKALLDLGCNQGYWAARFAQRGVARVAGFELRFDAVQQARLYWEQGGFLPEGAASFVRGDVSKDATWDLIHDAAPFELCFCSGVLHAVPDPEQLLQRMAAVAREALVIDTRVAEPGHELVPQDVLGVGPLPGTGQLRLLTQASLCAGLADAGFDVQLLSIEGPTPRSLRGENDYALGRRVALLATRSAP